MIHRENYGVYGARMVHAALLRRGWTVARCTVERLMRAACHPAWRGQGQEPAYYPART